jgi:hypothetical protein
VLKLYDPLSKSAQNDRLLYRMLTSLNKIERFHTHVLLGNPKLMLVIVPVLHDSRSILDTRLRHCVRR